MAEMKSGPKVRLGTKCASIMSICSMSVPRLRKRPISLPRFIRSEHMTETESLF